MDSRALGYAHAFVAVGRERHFARAAASLGLSQSSISRQIAELEAALGFSLVERSTRHVALTPAGQRLWSGLVDGLGLIEDALAEAREYARGRKGLVRIGYTRLAMVSVGGAAIQALRREFPDIVLELHEMGTNRQAEALSREEIDIGLLHPPVSAEGIDLRAIGEDEIGIAVSHTNRLAGADRVAVKQLAGQPGILYPRAVGPALYDAVLDLYRAADLTPSIVQECTSWDAAVDLAAEGSEVAWVPRAIAARHAGTAVFVAVEGAPRLTLAVATRRGARDRGMRALADRIGLAKPV